jgi:FtsP/CotA-like multicopper oxidase with cupredoxin domain
MSAPKLFGILFCPRERREKGMRKVLYLAVAVAILVGLFLAFAPKKADSRSAPSVPLAPAPQAGTTVEIKVHDGRLAAGPAVIKLKQGDQVTLRVTSDSNDELHVHGYDLHLNLIAGQPAQLSFTADHSGRFEYELHHAHTDLGAFEVYPR